MKKQLLYAFWALTLVAALFSIIGKARAGNVAALRSYDDGTTLMFVANTRSDYDGVTIINLAVAKAPLTVKSVQVQGNKQALTTCPNLTNPSKDTCPFRWERSKMRAGSNDISILVTLSNNAQYITTGTIGQPAKTTTSIDLTIFPPPPVIVASTAPPCGYLLGDNGARLTSSGGFLLAC